MNALTRKHERELPHRRYPEHSSQCYVCGNIGQKLKCRIEQDVIHSLLELGGVHILELGVEDAVRHVEHD
jgi:hypothetical protein